MAPFMFVFRVGPEGFDSGSSRKETIMSLWTVLFIILLIAWLSGVTVFHVAGGLIHLLLVLALVSLVVHFVSGTRAV